MFNSNNKLQILFFFLFALTLIKSQINIKLDVDTASQTANISFINSGNENIVIPINTKNLQPYFSDNCLIKEIDFNRYDCRLCPTLIIFDEKNKEQIETFISGHFNIEDFDSIRKLIKNEEKLHSKKIRKWKKRNNINSVEIAKINFYIMNNLLFLKPNEIQMFKIPLNFRNLGDVTKYSLIEGYHVEESKNYNGFIEFCVDKKLYNYLTPEQLHQLKNYKLFEGKIESNRIVVTSNENNN